MLSVRARQDRSETRATGARRSASGAALGRSPDHPTPARPAERERERETLLQLQRAMQRRREQGYSNTDTPRSCFELSRGEANVPDVRAYKGKRALDGLKAGDRHLVDDVN